MGERENQLSLREQAKLARQAARQLALFTEAEKNRALELISTHLWNNRLSILLANEEDMKQAAKAGQPESYLDRLRLTEERIAGLVESVRQLIALPDPVGEEIARWTRDDGLQFVQVRVPIGVVGMVYEARPNVTVDAAAIALKTGNAIVLRGSRSALSSNLALTGCIRAGLAEAGLPADAVQYLIDQSHEGIDQLCTMNGLIDVVIPRGGADLIKRVVRTATVPVLETGAGNCHIFVDQSARFEMAEAIVLNAKTSRPAVCNAAETLLLHQQWPQDHQHALLSRLLAAGVRLHVCPVTAARHPELAGQLQPATDSDWDAEYLDLTLAVRTVADLDEAIRHIARHSTGHSEAIVTEDALHAKRFLSEIDAACVYHNASTRFTDGGEFGFGAEIGISTQKLHARGPMGLRALTSSKYQICGNGHIR